jgi:hypothetical protein
LHDISNKKPVVSEPDIVQRKIEESSPEIPSSSSQTNDMPTFAQPQARTEPQKEKKGRFGFFSRKKNDNDRRKEEDEKRRREEERARKELEDQKSTAESEEQGQEIMTEEKQEVKEKGKDDQDRTPEEKDKVIYLTDEDIEDLLK